MIKIVHTNKGISPDGDNLDNIQAVPRIEDEVEIKKILADPELGFFHVTANELYSCNKLKFNDKYIVFIEPNPVAFYYSLAKGAELDFPRFKKTLEVFHDDKKKLHESLRSELVIFSYIFKVGCVGVIFSFLALEAFLNQMLPDYVDIEWKNKKHSKKNLQRNLTFNDKISKLLPQITDKNFQSSFPKDFDLLMKIKSLRDELTHLKNNKDNFLACYTEIYQNILDLDLTELLGATKKFINFYYENLIME